jgi:hypothetical protein
LAKRSLIVDTKLYKRKKTPNKKGKGQKDKNQPTSIEILPNFIKNDKQLTRRKERTTKDNSHPLKRTPKNTNA